MQSITDLNASKLPAKTFQNYDDTVTMMITLGRWWWWWWCWTWWSYQDLKTVCLNSSPWKPLPRTSMLATIKFRWLKLRGFWHLFWQCFLYKVLLTEIENFGMDIKIQQEIPIQCHMPRINDFAKFCQLDFGRHSFWNQVFTHPSISMFPGLIWTFGIGKLLITYRIRYYSSSSYGLHGLGAQGMKAQPKARPMGGLNF